MKVEILNKESDSGQYQFDKSPMNYIGNKYKLLWQIVPLFPKNIKTFVDLFCGGCDVVVNVTAKNKKANDYNENLIALYKALQKHTSDYVVDYIKSTIKKWNLNTKNLNGFKRFREYYNETQNPLDLYVLSRFSYNYQIRFNNAKEYNSSFGYEKSKFNNVNKQNLIKFINNIKNINFSSEDFKDYDFSNLDSNDFVYLDPPYLLAGDTYRYKSRESWNIEKDRELFEVMKELNKKKVRFALSNVIKHKNLVHEELIQFAKDNEFNIINLNYDYHNSSSNLKDEHLNTITEEILLTNY